MSSVKSAKDFNRKPMVGETLFLKHTSGYSSPHCHALYLGEDDTGDKVLLPTYTDGYSIVDISSVDPLAYRPIGRCNLRKEELDKDGFVAFEYVFFDTKVKKGVRERKVGVRKIEGRWLIISRPENPSWCA